MVWGWESSSWTQPVDWNVSHFVTEEPSTRFSLTSPPLVFSPLACIDTSVSVTLPGMQGRLGPVTPWARSAVSTHVGCGSFGSNEEEKLGDAAWAGAESAKALSVSASVQRTRRYVIGGPSQSSLIPCGPAVMTTLSSAQARSMQHVPRVVKREPRVPRQDAPAAATRSRHDARSRGAVLTFVEGHGDLLPRVLARGG